MKSKNYVTTYISIYIYQHFHLYFSYCQLKIFYHAEPIVQADLPTLVFFYISTFLHHYTFVIMMANNNDMLQKTIKSKSREFGLFSCVACKNAILRHTIFVALPSSPNFIAYLLFAFFDI